mmetsp:Transcript_31986/g.88392  ORF Transcript_31986/g.88392 Transcript_31986/m.88392 type:complete len:221 (-) Transcript_31986:184-846(-)
MQRRSMPVFQGLQGQVRAHADHERQKDLMVARVRLAAYGRKHRGRAAAAHAIDSEAREPERVAHAMSARADLPTALVPKGHAVPRRASGRLNQQIGVATSVLSHQRVEVSHPHVVLQVPQPFVVGGMDKPVDRREFRRCAWRRTGEVLHLLAVALPQRFLRHGVGLAAPGGRRLDLRDRVGTLRGVHKHDDRQRRRATQPGEEVRLDERGPRSGHDDDGR